MRAVTLDRAEQISGSFGQRCCRHRPSVVPTTPPGAAQGALWVQALRCMNHDGLFLSSLFGLGAWIHKPNPLGHNSLFLNLIPHPTRVGLSGPLGQVDSLLLGASQAPQVLGMLSFRSPVRVSWPWTGGRASLLRRLCREGASTWFETLLVY